MFVPSVMGPLTVSGLAPDWLMAMTLAPTAPLIVAVAVPLPMLKTEPTMLTEFVRLIGLPVPYPFRVILPVPVIAPDRVR